MTKTLDKNSVYIFQILDSETGRRTQGFKMKASELAKEIQESARDPLHTIVLFLHEFDEDGNIRDDHGAVMSCPAFNGLRFVGMFGEAEIEGENDNG